MPTGVAHCPLDICPLPAHSPTSDVSDQGTLSVECRLDGTLDDAMAISSCSALAVRSVPVVMSVNATQIDRIALFPVE